METTTKRPDGSPDPGLQTKDRETAGIVSERKLKLLPLKFQREVDGIYYFSDSTGSTYRGDASDYEELMSIQREDRADRVRADKQDEEPIIDAEESNRALQIVAQLKRKRIHHEITSIQRAHGLVGRSS